MSTMVNSHLFSRNLFDFDYRFNPPLGWAIFNPCSYEFGGRKLVNKWGNIYWIRIRRTCSIHLTSFLTLNRLFCGFSDSIYSTLYCICTDTYVPVCLGWQSRMNRSRTAVWWAYSMCCESITVCNCTVCTSFSRIIFHILPRLIAVYHG